MAKEWHDCTMTIIKKNIKEHQLWFCQLQRQISTLEDRKFIPYKNLQHLARSMNFSFFLFCIQNRILKSSEVNKTIWKLTMNSSQAPKDPHLLVTSCLFLFCVLIHPLFKTELTSNFFQLCIDGFWRSLKTLLKVKEFVLVGEIGLTMRTWTQSDGE